MTIGTNNSEEEMATMKAMLEMLIKKNKEKEMFIKLNEEKMTRLTTKLKKREPDPLQKAHKYLRLPEIACGIFH